MAKRGIKKNMKWSAARRRACSLRAKARWAKKRATEFFVIPPATEEPRTLGYSFCPSCGLKLTT